MTPNEQRQRLEKLRRLKELRSKQQPQQGQIVETNDFIPTDYALNMPQDLTGIQKPEGNSITGLVDAALVTGQNVGANIVGGLESIKNLVTGMDPAEANAQLSQTIQKLSAQPRNQKSELMINELSKMLNQVGELGTSAAAGVVGLGQLASNPTDIQGMNQVVQNVKDRGLGGYLGETTFQATGSPIAATVAEVSPDLVGMLAGATGLQRGVGGASSTVQKLEGKALQSNIARMEYFDRNKDKIETSNMMIQSPRGINIEEDRILRETMSPTQLAELGYKPVKDTLAKNVIAQGFDESLISRLKTFKPSDRKEALKMVDIVRKGMSDKMFRENNRPSDIVGGSLAKRVDYLFDRKKQAGKALGKAIDKIADQPIPMESIQAFTNTIRDGLAQRGVTLNPDLSLDFGDRMIPDADKRQLIKIMDNIKNRRAGNAKTAHELKQDINKQVDYDSGLLTDKPSGDFDSVLKGAANELNQGLRAISEDYAIANDIYSKAIRPLMDLQKEAGKKIDIESPDARSSLGTLAKKIYTNYPSRTAVKQAVESVNNSARDLGAKFDDDVFELMLLADELEDKFKLSPSNAFAGNVQKGTRAATEAVNMASMDPLAQSATIIDKLSEKFTDQKKRERKALESIDRLIRERK